MGITTYQNSATLCTINKQLELNQGRGLQPDYPLEKQIPTKTTSDSCIEFALNLINKKEY